MGSDIGWFTLDKAHGCGTFPNWDKLVSENLDPQIVTMAKSMMRSLRHTFVAAPSKVAEEATFQVDWSAISPSGLGLVFKELLADLIGAPPLPEVLRERELYKRSWNRTDISSIYLQRHLVGPVETGFLVRGVIFDMPSLMQWSPQVRRNWFPGSNRALVACIFFWSCVLHYHQGIATVERMHWNCRRRTRIVKKSASNIAVQSNHVIRYCEGDQTLVLLDGNWICMKDIHMVFCKHIALQFRV